MREELTAEPTSPSATEETPAAAVPAPTIGARRRRRPTGAPPPLPRNIGITGKLWLILLVTLLIWVPAALAFTAVLRVADRADTAFLREVARLRTAWLTDVMKGIDRVGSGWLPTVLLVGIVVALLVFKRWRHLFTLLGGIVVFEVVSEQLYHAFGRPRPFGVTILGNWSGSSMPSAPVVALSAALVTVLYTLVVPGRPRTVGKWAVAFVVAAFVGARLYLAVDHPSDVIVGVTLGVAIPLVAFRLFTPNEVFPVAYRRGKTAHLDIGGVRGEAIRRAVRDQLGLTVVDMQPVGLAGSGGSTPLRLRVQGEPDQYLFAKLYAMNHVRADRWYKLGRTILYGRLEDESPYQGVRRLVEYEDYAARVMTDVGIPTATSYGVVELTPDREYLLVTDFFDGAAEIGEADIDDNVIDEALLMVRRLWDAGLAHRDIKPANLMVLDGHVLLIDVAFMQVRPSPWRQAVDLANMMLVLAVRTDAERVYRKALQYFSPDDIAEAFAATRGVASPSQLRTAMKQDGRDLIAQFRALAPERRPIALQRWSARRIALAVALVAATAIGVTQTLQVLSPGRDLRLKGSPDCGTGDLMVLIAQSVPSATLVPCLATLPAGWKLNAVDVDRGKTTFSLDSDVGGKKAVEVALVPRDTCDVSAAKEVPSEEVAARRFVRPDQVRPLRSTSFYLFRGGCVTYRLAFNKAATPSLLFDVDQALDLQPRQELVRAVDDRYDLRLCGAGVPCPGGRP